MIKEQIHTILAENLQSFKLNDSFGHRSVGDKIEYECSIIVEKANKKNYKKAKSKRSIEDFTITNSDKNFYFDVKTHHIQDTDGFSMPNLISVKRLKKILNSTSDDLVYIFIDYTRNNGNVIIQDIHVKYVWELDWNILTIGALGKGQLQIKDANKKLVFTNMGKDKWFSVLRTKVLEFYKNEIVKINKELNNWK